MNNAVSGSLLTWTGLAATGRNHCSGTIRTGTTTVVANGRGSLIVQILSGSGTGTAEMEPQILAGSVAMTAGTQSGSSMSAVTMTVVTVTAVIPTGSLIGETTTDNMNVLVRTAPATTALAKTALVRTALAMTAPVMTAPARTAVTRAVTSTAAMIVVIKTGGMMNAVTMTGNEIAVMATGGMMTGVAESKTAAMEDMTGAVTAVMRPGTEAETVATVSVVGRTGTTKTVSRTGTTKTVSRTAAVEVAAGMMSAVATRTAKL